MSKVDNKHEKFVEALKKINGEFKNGDISLLKDITNVDVPTIDSGSLVLNTILGGGLAQGRIIEIYGAEASGKTSIALTAIGNVQRQGGTAVFIDAEQALDPRYAQKLGVDLNSLGFSQAIIAEDVMKLVQDMCESGAVDIIVVDSIASLIPRAEFNEEGFDKVSISLVARLMSKALRKIAVVANRNNCTVILLNQTRANIGVMYGPNTVTPGGNALKFFASQRIEVKRRGKVEEDGEIIGNEIFLRCIKNKIAPPYAEGMTVVSFNKGINRSAELFKLGESLGIISKEGRTYYCDVPETVNIDGFLSERMKDNPTRIKIGVNAKPVLKEIENNKALFDELSKQLTLKLKAKNGEYSDEEQESEVDLAEVEK